MDEVQRTLEYMVKRDSTTWVCGWLNCAHGAGLSGSGICPGDPTNDLCSKYKIYELKDELRD